MSDQLTVELPIIVWAPDFDENSGGAIVLHTLAHRLVQLGQDVYLANEATVRFAPARGLWGKIVSPIKQANRRRLARWRGKVSEAGGVTPIKCHPSMPVPTYAGTLNAEVVAVYPEVTSGDPIQAKHVVRWLLHRPGFHLDGIRFGDDELTFFYQAAFAEGLGHVDEGNLLQVRWLRTDVYRNEGRSDRSGKCRMVRKGTATYRPEMSKGDAAPILDGKSHEEIAEVFNRCDFFYSHDPYTLYLYYAALCGCTPVVVPQPGLDAASWRAGFELKQGVAYGEDEIPFAVGTREGLFADMAAARETEDAAVRTFLAKIKTRFGC
ncbi:MAG: hypothetical protein ACKO2N_03975 [Tabrizicola sp.]